ncbi:MAG: ClpXP protease specificity-enhancing factor [Proteobacteria bacterium]|nr:ClpXP protease specificity-enhancing factor [Pseudomonadota bacterium]
MTIWQLKLSLEAVGQISGKLSAPGEIVTTIIVINRKCSKRPYLIRAMRDWMCDNSNTPHIVVDTSVDGISVPLEHVKDGKIILNISDSAAHNLKLSNDAVSFRARFSGVPYDVWVPMRSVLGIYARETGHGMIFSHNAEPTERGESPELQDEVEETRLRPHLTIVK